MFKVLPGFREFYPEDCAKKNYIFAHWRNTAKSFGFVEFEPPVLEQLDLFTEKSGEEIKSQLFEFVDKGERAVSLRPEMTPSLARMVGARAAGIRRPVKWFAIGENYRYERQQKGRLRAFFQYNADILGENSINADAEIICLLIESLRSFGLTSSEFKLRLGDRNLWVLFLQSAGVDGDRLVSVLSVVDKFEKVSPQALSEMMAEALAGSQVDSEELISKIRAFIALKDVDSMRSAFPEGGELGSKIDERIADWKTLLMLLDNMGVGDFISPDLGIVRGLAYYTGFVFEAFQTVGTGRALAGGGRYDNLVKKLGYQDMPAVGFGMGDVTVSDLLELVGKGGSLDMSPDAYLIIGSEDLRPMALKLAGDLRRAGVKLDYPFKASGYGKQFKQADAVGASYAIILGEDEARKNIVKIKNLKTGSESEAAFEDIPSALK